MRGSTAKRKLKMPIRSTGQTYLWQPQIARASFLFFHTVPSHTWHRYLCTLKCARVIVQQLMARKGKSTAAMLWKWGEKANVLTPLCFSQPLSYPCGPTQCTKDLSWDNEKLKCDGFNYNLYFHLAINYLLLIGGTSLSPNTSSREKFSPGEQLVPESCTRMGFQSPRS